MTTQRRLLYEIRYCCQKNWCHSSSSHILVHLIIFTIKKNHIPIGLAIFSTLVIGELIVIFSNLKMRYWFPSLPVYFIVGAYSLGPDSFFSTTFDPELIMYSTLCSVAIQIIIMITVTFVEHTSKLETSKLKIIKTACLGENTETNINIFKPSKKLIYAVIIQMVAYTSDYFWFTEFYKTLILLSFAVVSIIPIILKVKFRYWALSMGVTGFLADFMNHYKLPENCADYLFGCLVAVQVLVIPICFIVRFIIRYIRARKSVNSIDSGAWDSPGENLVKTPGQN
jgi:hypothetical protein